MHFYECSTHIDSKIASRIWVSKASLVKNDNGIEFERAMILERQREGIAIAKREGKYKGRKAISVPNIGDYYDRYMSRQETKTSISAELGISRTTLDKLFKEYKEEIL